MASFNPLEHPVCFSFPERIADSTWTQHVPFGMLLVDLLRPRQVVELGAYRGTSYCGFCQAVAELKLDTRCYAVDTWEGDEQSGFYGPEILADLRTHHDARYETFSRLIQATFDDARPMFAEGAIDLLHIDGYHTYESVKHDFETWLPAMSERGVVIFHDIAEKQGDFGVWRLWDELKSRYPSLEFLHGHGLGLIAVGSVIPEALQPLLDTPENEWPIVREFFFQLGRRIETRQRELALATNVDYLQRKAEENTRAFEQRDAESARVVAQYEARVAEAQAERESLRTQLNQAAEAERRTLVNGYEATLRQARQLAGAAANDAEYLRQQLAILDSSRGVRAVKLARASRAVLKHKGPAALAKHVALWTVGKRGYYLRDIMPVPSAPQPEPSQDVRHVSGAEVRAEKLPKQPAFTGVSIVIPVFNALEYTKACVDSLYRVAGATPFEVIVVDNGSRPEVLTWLQVESERRERMWYISLTENLGFSKAVNLGMRQARGQYLLLLNSDTVVTTGWLDRLVSAAESDPRIGIVSPITNYVGEGLQIAPAARGLPVSQAETFAASVREVTQLLYPPERLVFFCVLIKRQVVNLLGSLDEGYGLGNFEDEDYSVRTRLAGFTLAIAQNAFVYHHGSKTFADNQINHDALMAGNYYRYLNLLSTFSSLYIPGKTRARVEQPEVSVIVRTVNRPETLAVALTSLVNQTFDNFEVVVVNDAGADVSDLLRSFEDRLTIQYIRHSESLGMSAGLTTGVRAARGKYVCYLDDDDVVYPFHLEALWQELRASGGKYKFVYSDYNRALMKGRGAAAITVSRHPLPTWEFNRDQLQVSNYIAIHTWMHERDCVEAVGGFSKDILLLGDWDFLLRMAAKYEFHPIRRITCEYRFYTDVGNSLVKGRQRSLEELQKVYDRYPVADPKLRAEREAALQALRDQVISTDAIQKKSDAGMLTKQEAFAQIVSQVAGFPVESY
ncbi:MAG TPA: glycosyltransferase [Ktedonobacterales bacterium]|nr:glycosyltransferase [Ktedonobacterales bacterium]